MGFLRLHLCRFQYRKKLVAYLPRKADDDCLQELRWLYERRDIVEAQRDLPA